MAVNGAQIDRPASAAARTEDVEPRRPGDQRGPDCWRPQHVTAGGEAPIPAIDDELRLKGVLPCPPSAWRHRP
jgi:hypothetical protein